MRRDGEQPWKAGRSQGQERMPRFFILGGTAALLVAIVLWGWFGTG
jgi:hypothetical protein